MSPRILPFPRFRTRSRPSYPAMTEAAAAQFHRSKHRVAGKALRTSLLCGIRRASISLIAFRLGARSVRALGVSRGIHRIGALAWAVNAMRSSIPCNEVADVLTEQEVDADLRAHWGDRDKLSPSLRRRYDAERELRLDLAKKGQKPAPWIVEEIRAGAWFVRQRGILLNIRRTRGRLARLKRDGYSFDAEHRLVAPALTRTRPPDRSRAQARPREHRPARRASASSRDGPSRSDDDDPHNLGAPRAFAAASTRAAVHLGRRRASVRPA
jgi:hypothetical protein